MSESQRPMRGRIAAQGEWTCSCCSWSVPGGTRASEKRLDRRDIEEQIRDAREHGELK